MVGDQGNGTVFKISIWKIRPNFACFGLHFYSSVTIRCMTKDTLFLGPCQPIKSFFRQKVSDLNIHLSRVSRRTQVFSGLLYHPSKRIVRPLLATVIKRQKYSQMLWCKQLIKVVIVNLYPQKILLNAQLYY